MPLSPLNAMSSLGKMLDTCLPYNYCLKKIAVDAFTPLREFMKNSNAMKVTVMILGVMACSVTSVAQGMSLSSPYAARNHNDFRYSTKSCFS